MRVYGTIILVLWTAFAASRAGAEAVTEKIDALVEAGWRDANVEPAAPASDAEFLRRVYLDVAGRVPRVDEAKRFLDSDAPGKRDSLIEELLASDDYARQQARQWTILLMGRSQLPRQANRGELEEWLFDRFKRGAGFDDIVREAITATGSPVENPAANYLLRFEMKPEDVAESVSSSFLGLSIGCARCHDHPYESWSQEDFLSMAAAFGELGVERPSRRDRRKRREFQRKRREMQERQRRASDMSPEERMAMRDDAMAAFDELRATFRLTDMPRKKFETEIDGETRIFEARFLDGTRPKGNPREELAEWMVSRDNPYFARATVNRIWESFFGRGLVDPVDAFGELNPPSHPELLDLLAEDFVKHGFDPRRTARLITSSRAYQRSSRFTGEPPAPELFAVARPRRMSPEQLFDSLIQIVSDGLPERSRLRARFEERREIFFRRFVFLFDTDAVNDVEIAQGTIPQALALFNSPISNQAVVGGEMARARGRRTPTDWLQSIDELYLRALSRYPTGDERDEMKRFFAASENPVAGSADALWALLNSSEFILVH